MAGGLRLSALSVRFGWKADVAEAHVCSNEAPMQTVSKDSLFHFQPRWKEELVVKGNGGSFVLEHPMGMPSVYLPTEVEWRRRAPAWALDHWGALKGELEQWCRDNDIRLHIEASADLYPA